MNSLQLKKIGLIWSLSFGSLKCILPKQLNEDKNITLDIQENETFLITSDGSVYEIKIKDNAIILEAMHQATVVTKCDTEPIDTKLTSIDHTIIGENSAGVSEDTSKVIAQEIECVKPKPAIVFLNENETIKSELEKETLEEIPENVQIHSESCDVFPLTDESQENVNTQLYVDNGLRVENSGSFEQKVSISLGTGIAIDKGELITYDIQKALHEHCLPSYRDETGSNASNKDVSIKYNALELETYVNEPKCLQNDPYENSNVLKDSVTLSSEIKTMIIDKSTMENSLFTADSEKAADNVAEMETLLFSIKTSSDIYVERASFSGYDIEQEDPESFKTQSLSLSAIHKSYKQTRDQTATVSKISPSNKVPNSPNAPPVPPRSYVDAATRPKTIPAVTTQPSTDGQSHVFVCYTSTNIGVKVYKADILNVAVDCIVNPANEDLNHNCGLAKVIAKRAGPAIVSECNAYRYKHSIIPVGNAVATTAGKLHYKCVVHAVGPLWNSYCPYTLSNVQRCRDDLRNTIFQCLITAELMKMESIAFPSVGAGLASVPDEMCAAAYADALIEFENAIGFRNRALREVHFVDIDVSMVSLIKQTFVVMIKDRKPCPHSFQAYISTIPTTPVNKDGFVGDLTGGMNDIETNKHEQQHDKKFPSYLEQDDKLMCAFSNSHTIQIYDGDIFAIRGVKAIVCAEDATGFANKLKNLGEYFSKQKKVENVVISRGGQTNFDWVLHASFPLRHHFNSYSEWKISFRNTFDIILGEVIGEGITSVAMSLLETDMCDAESDEGTSDIRRYAEMFLDSYVVACNRNTGKQLTVHMVNNKTPKTVCLAKLFKEHVDNLAAESCLSNSIDHKDLDVDRNVVDTSTHYLNLGHQGNDRPAEKNSVSNNPLPVTRRTSQTEKCPICLGGINRPKKLICSHTFCTDCIDQYFKAFHFKTQNMCYTCGHICGILIGDQPPGDMVITKTTDKLAGFRKSMTLSLTYTFKDGEQQTNHPNPGYRYSGFKGIAYLPDTGEGRAICAMLSVAFKRKLVFTIGRSRTNDGLDVITWNNIHHKTSLTPCATYGYPDIDYFERVRGELKSKGITEADIDKGFPGKLRFLYISGTIKV